MNLKLLNFLKDFNILSPNEYFHQGWNYQFMF